MKINRYIYGFILLLALSINSCYKDLGNYDYTRLNEIEITNVEALYPGQEVFKDTLIINPIIKFGDEDNDAFSGVWFIKKEGIWLDTIAKGIDLELPITISGRHYLVLELTYERLNLKYYFDATFEASSHMERGYYILKETQDGNTDMDAFLLLKADSIQESFNLISSVLKEPLLGKPVDIDYWDWVWHDETVTDSVITRTDRVIRPVSEKELAIFRMQDFSYLGNFSTILSDDIPFAERNIEAMISIYETTFLFYNGGKMRLLGNAGMYQTSHFIPDFPGNYELEPCVSSQKNGSALLFDKTAGSIVGLNGISNSTFSILPDTAISFFPSLNFQATNGTVNKLSNVNLKYCGRANSEKGIPPLGRMDETAYFLFEKQQYPDSLLLYQLSLGPIAGGQQNAFLSLISIDTLKNTYVLKGAKHYAMHSKGEYLYFNNGSKVYYYNFEQMRDNMVLDFGGEEVTYLRHVRWTADLEGYNFNCLLVGTYSAGKYKLYFYEMSGALPATQPMRILEGEGKIKTFVYTNPVSKIDNFYIYQ